MAIHENGLHIFLGFIICYLRDIRLFTAWTIRSGELSEKSGRTATTISAFSGYTSLLRRNDSLNIRLIRFLTTAPFTFLLTLMPIRLWVQLLAMKIRLNPSPCSRLPFR
jgi:hypothetical protein